MLADRKNTYLQGATSVSDWRVLRPNRSVSCNLQPFGRNWAPFLIVAYAHRVVNRHFINRNRLTWIVGKLSFTP